MKCRYVGASPTVLASGHPVAPGETVSTPLTDPHDQQLHQDGLLIEVKTAKPADPVGDQTPARRRRNSKENG